MPLPDHLHPYLLATLNRIVQHPGLPDQITHRLDTDAQDLAQQLPTWLESLRNESFAVFGEDFLTLHESTQDELFDRIEAQNYRTDWKEIDPAATLQRLVDLAAQAYSSLNPTAENP